MAKKSQIGEQALLENRTEEAEIRKAVMRCAPNANAVSKEIIFASQTLLGKEIIDFAAKGFAEAIIGEEGREGIASFLEKRKPRWAEEN